MASHFSPEITFPHFYQMHSDIVAPVEREIRTLANDLKTVKDEQEYILVRERRHRNTAESTNSRVKWWSIVQSIVLFLVVAWQVYYLKVRASFLRPDRPLTTSLLCSRSSK
jgi:hypothetical protein